QRESTKSSSSQGHSLRGLGDHHHHAKDHSSSHSAHATSAQPTTASNALPPTLSYLPSLSSNKKQQFCFALNRPKVNSILNIFGNWLFNASLICGEQQSLENFASGKEYSDRIEGVASSTSLGSNAGGSS